MSWIINLAHNMHQFVPTADHDYVPAFSQSEQTEALTKLFRAYSTANAQEKSAIENGFYHLMEMQPDYINKSLLDLVNMYRHQYPFINKAIQQLDTSTEFKKKLKK